MLLSLLDSVLGCFALYRLWRHGLWYRVGKNTHPRAVYYIRNPSAEWLAAAGDDEPWTTIQSVR
jgi:hypothetical protein